MTSDTIRQKYIYNTPYNDDEFPLVLEDNIDINKSEYFSIDASFLYFLEEQDFIGIVNALKSSRITNVVIINDYHFKNTNKILNNASLCHIMSFVYLFKKNGLKCMVIY